MMWPAMFDGTFPRGDLVTLLQVLDGASSIRAELRESGWPCTVMGTVAEVAVTIRLRPHWARGRAVVALTGEVMEQLRRQLDAIQSERVWLHAEPPAITIQPSAEP